MLKDSYNKNIIELLRDSYGAYIDDSSFEKVIRYTTNVSRFIKDEEEHIVLVSVDERFTIRPFEIGDDGLPHLSSWKFVDFPRCRDTSNFNSSIEVYNGKSLISKTDIGTITGTEQLPSRFNCNLLN